MKNIVLKTDFYKDIHYMNHIYFLDVDFDFNEKNIEDIIKFVDNPLIDVMIHSNDLTVDVIQTLKEIGKYRNIWFETKNILFEDFAVMEKESIETLGINHIDVMIDGLGEMIDLQKSLEEGKILRADYWILPF